MAEQNDDTPKIIVDDDWKTQARQEQAAQDAASHEEAPPDELPAPSILEIVQILLMQATVGLGLVQDPQTGKAVPPNLPLAKHYIDLLELLHAKTAGKLDEAEKEQMEGALHQLHMVFVEVSAGRMAPPAADPGPEPVQG